MRATSNRQLPCDKGPSHSNILIKMCLQQNDLLLANTFKSLFDKIKTLFPSQSIGTGLLKFLLLFTTHLKLICVVVHASSISIHLFVTPLMEILQPITKNESSKYGAIAREVKKMNRGVRFLTVTRS